MARCIIFSAGDYKGGYSKKDGDYIIAADAGYHHLEKLKICPDMLLGDFDTIQSIPDHNNIITFNKDKDYTDTELAVIEGIKMGFREFVIYGALGGKRLEHTIANIKLCESYSEKGCSVLISDGDYYVTALSNSQMTFSKDEKGYISVFSLSGKAEGVSIKGLKYELYKADIDEKNPTLCVSNEFIGKDAAISVEKGTVTIIWQRSIENEA